ncbi:hypothetical protein [Pseudomonas sp. NFX1]|uniref:hypothetical protein n=1 Tax=Pseudomonas sp. NFX1 TaxID=2201355 RepID=UPI003DA779BF
MHYANVTVALCRATWCVLRICSGVLLLALGGCIVFGVVFSESWEVKGRRVVDPMVCGKLSGLVYEFPREYMIYWPEYEGKSSWEPGFTENKKGCDANLVSLYMAMSWPEIKPVSFGEATSFSFTGVTTAIEPWVHGEAGLKKVLDVYLRATPVSVVEQATYDKHVELHHVEGVNSALPNHKEDYYWAQEGGRVKYVIACVRGYRGGESFCSLKFLLADKRALVSLRFLRSQLKEWKRVASAVEGFILLGIRCGDAR